VSAPTFYVEPCNIGSGRVRFTYRVMRRQPDGSVSCYSRHKSREAAEARMAKVAAREAHYQTIKDRL